MTSLEETRRKLANSISIPAHKLTLVSDLLFRVLENSNITIGELMAYMGIATSNDSVCACDVGADEEPPGAVFFDILDEINIQAFNGELHEDNNEDRDCCEYDVTSMFGLLGYSVKYVKRGIELKLLSFDARAKIAFERGYTDDMQILRVLGKLVNYSAVDKIGARQTIADFTVRQINEICEPMGLEYNNFNLVVKQAT